MFRSAPAEPAGALSAACVLQSRGVPEAGIRMRNVSRLVVAIDFNRDGATLTAGSCLATSQAVELLKHIDATFVLLHSIGPDWPTARGQSSDVARNSAQCTLDQVADRFRVTGVASALHAGALGLEI
jgi:hypothetical protein